MDLGFEDLENVKDSSFQKFQNRFASNDLLKLDSGEGIAQFVPGGGMHRNRNSTPLLKNEVVEISRIPLQEAVKNGNGKLKTKYA